MEAFVAGLNFPFVLKLKGQKKQKSHNKVQYL